MTAYQQADGPHGDEGVEREDRARLLTGGRRKRGYGEPPSWGLREGGRERTRSFEEVGRDLLQGEREEKVFISGPEKN